jgi:hypothetical protein
VCHIGVFCSKNGDYYSTVQYSTVQYSTVQYIPKLIRSPPFFYLSDTVITTVGAIPLFPGQPVAFQGLHLLGCLVGPEDVVKAVGQHVCFRPLIGIKRYIAGPEETPGREKFTFFNFHGVKTKKNKNSLILKRCNVN